MAALEQERAPVLLVVAGLANGAAGGLHLWMNEEKLKRIWGRNGRSKDGNGEMGIKLGEDGLTERERERGFRERECCDGMTEMKREERRRLSSFLWVGVLWFFLLSYTCVCILAGCLLGWLAAVLLSQKTLLLY